MADADRVVTTKLDGRLVDQLDEVAGRLERSKSWVVREALAEWLGEEERRYQLTLEALAEVDAGRTISQENVEKHFEARRKARSAARTA